MKHRRRILIVDDEQGVRELLRAELDKEATVRCVATGEDALALRAEERRGVDAAAVAVDLERPGLVDQARVLVGAEQTEAERGRPVVADREAVADEERVVPLVRSPFRDDDALASAQVRIENLEKLEKEAAQLKSENAELRHETTRMQQQLETTRHSASEVDELRLQNKELAHCLQSMENSRRQYEQDAKRYRDQAEQSEQLSDTLRIKLGDVEKNIAKMAKQQKKAEKHVVKQGNGSSNGKAQPAGEREVDDLTKIVGIGKVFQHTLHKLGIYSFRQLANFGPEDIARVIVEAVS